MIYKCTCTLTQYKNNTYRVVNAHVQYIRMEMRAKYTVTYL